MRHERELMFTYLDLYVTSDGKVSAKISSESKVRSVGTSSSRWSLGPFATFALDGFSGIDAIGTDELVEELLTRMTAQQLTDYLIYEFSFDELIEMLKKRMK
jgi:hypothetical protein